MAAPEPTFNLMLLPPEVRQKVWELNLPSQDDDCFVVVGGVCMKKQDFFREDPIEWRYRSICRCLPGAYTTTDNKLPDTAVLCSDALAVADRHRHRPAVSKFHISWPFTMGSEFLTLPEEFLDHPYSNSAFTTAISTVITFFGLADKVGACPVIPWLYIRSEWDLSWARQLQGDLDLLKRFLDLCYNSRIAFISETIDIHASRKQAVESGLFGPSANEVTQVVDVTDWQQINRFFIFWNLVTLTGSKKASAIDDVWAVVLDAERLAWINRSVEEWKRKFLHAQLCLTARDDETLTNVFPAGEDFPFNLTEGHPWVEAARASLPRIELKLVFRLCTRIKCVREPKKKRRRRA